MKNRILSQLRNLVLLLILFPLERAVQAEVPVVYALLFYSPSCPHCHKVITEDLPPIIDKYGDQLLVLGINTYSEEGNELFLSAVSHFNISEEMAGVLMLIIGETVLIGSYEIPQLLPGIISEGLVSGGIDWPDIPGLAQLLKDEVIAESKENNSSEDEIEENLDADKQENIPSADINQDEFEEERVSQKEQSSTVTGDIVESILTTENMSLTDRFMQDRTGNSIRRIVCAKKSRLFIPISPTPSPP